MIKVENGKITQTSLPQHGYIDGRFVSTMANVPKEDLLRNGWYDAEHDKPAYDPAYEKLSQPNYSYDKTADKVTATYTVIERAEAVLKRRLDEIELEIRPEVLKLRQELETTQDVLILNDIITEAEKAYIKEPIVEDEPAVKE